MWKKYWKTCFWLTPQYLKFVGFLKYVWLFFYHQALKGYIVHYLQSIPIIWTQAILGWFCVWQKCAQSKNPGTFVYFILFLAHLSISSLCSHLLFSSPFNFCIFPFQFVSNSYKKITKGSVESYTGCFCTQRSSSF